MSQPEISVVMPVYNEAQCLDDTIQSIIDQTGVTFEFIIVDDGSTDSSNEILCKWADKDDRITVVRQKNSGVTKALIEGCKLAKGEFIARQDAGDLSLPNRLIEQLKVFHTNPKIVLCSTGTHFYSERGEFVYENRLSFEDANKGLRPESLNELVGPPHHGCTMFKRSAYESCGAYRAEFKVAQDLDLWTRLIEFGTHECLEAVYYKSVLRPAAISTVRRGEQEHARRIIFECIQTRQSSGNDSECLKRLSEHDNGLSRTNMKRARENYCHEYHYFIGSNLLKTQPQKSRYYFRTVLRKRPWHLKSWVKFIASFIENNRRQ